MLLIVVRLLASSRVHWTVVSLQLGTKAASVYVKISLLVMVSQFTVTAYLILAFGQWTIRVTAPDLPAKRGVGWVCKCSDNLLGTVSLNYWVVDGVREIFIGLTFSPALVTFRRHLTRCQWKEIAIKALLYSHSKEVHTLYAGARNDWIIVRSYEFFFSLVLALRVAPWVRGL